MYTPLKLASLTLPLVTAIPYDFSVSEIHTRDAVTDIVTAAADIVEQVNAALGDILPTVIDTTDLLETTLDNIRQQAFEAGALEATFAGLLQAVVANYVPTDIPDALDRIANIVNSTDSTIENVAQLILNGLSVTDLTQNVLAGYLSGINSFNNVNPPPQDSIYPKKQAQDAPYSVPEAQLRAAIYIPPEFTYGTKRPILFVPGTGAFGGVNFISNLGKLLGNDGRFDPVYLNVPGAMLNDTQINSEYIAYAINYVGSITSNRNDLAVIPWSQGNLDTQWVFQYWPSTRPVVTDFISASADFHGTTLAYLLDPALVNPPLPPSIIQQEYDSNFVLTLRYGGGGSPYVNSTSVHSITDEIVQPQYSPYASADYFTQDLPGTPNSNPVCPVLRNISYTNNQIQTICAGQPAGGIYTHEGVLYNPLMYALTLDALTNDGPGRIDRIDLDTVCAQVVAPGLSLADVLATEGLIPLALINILLYPEKVTNEPAVMQYALQGNANCATNTTNTTTSTTTSSTVTSATATTTLLTTTISMTMSTETTTTTTTSLTYGTSSGSDSSSTTTTSTTSNLETTTTRSGTTSGSTSITTSFTTLPTSTYSHTTESGTSSQTSSTPTTPNGSSATTTTTTTTTTNSSGSSSVSTSTTETGGVTTTSDTSLSTTSPSVHSSLPFGGPSHSTPISSASSTDHNFSNPTSSSSIVGAKTNSYTSSIPSTTIGDVIITVTATTTKTVTADCGCDDVSAANETPSAINSSSEWQKW